VEPYGARIRKRIIELYEQEKSTADIARLLGTCPAGTRRVRQHLRERGTLEPLPAGGGGPKPVMDAAAQQRLRELVAQTPDATLAELRDRLHGADAADAVDVVDVADVADAVDVANAAGPLVSIATVDRWCKRLGLRFKKSRSGRRSRTART
jgi:'Paired box' domain